MPSSYAHSLWEGQQPRCFSVPLPTAGKKDEYRECKLKCSPTHCMVATGDAIHLYSLPDFVLQRTIRHSSGVKLFDFDVHDSLLAVVFCNGTLGIWDVSEGRPRSITQITSDAEIAQKLLYSDISITVPGLGRAKVSSNSPSTKENGVVPGEEGPMFVSWIYLGYDWRSKAKCQVWRLPNLGVKEGPPINYDAVNANPSLLVREMDDTLHIQCFDTFGSMTAAGFMDCTIRVWDIISGRCKWVLLGHLRPVTKLQLNSSKVCSTSDDDTIRVWDLVTGECLHILQSSLLRHLRLASTYITSLGPKALEIWDINSGQQTAYIDPPRWLSGFMYSSYLHVDDQKTVVGYEVGHGDNKIAGFVLWNTQSGNLFGDYTLTVHRWPTTVRGLYSGSRVCIALVKRRDDAYHLEVLDFGVDDDIHSDNSGQASRQDEEDSTPLEQSTKWQRMSVAGCGILYYVLVASLLYFSL